MSRSHPSFVLGKLVVGLLLWLGPATAQDQGVLPAPLVTLTRQMLSLADAGDIAGALNAAQSLLRQQEELLARISHTGVVYESARDLGPRCASSCSEVPV